MSYLDLIQKVSYTVKSKYKTVSVIPVLYVMLYINMADFSTIIWTENNTKILF